MSWESHYRLAKRAVRRYPRLLAKLEEKRSCAISSVYLTGSSGGASGRRPTESAALVSLRDEEQCMLDAVWNAIRSTRRLSDGADRMKTIGLLFWEQDNDEDTVAQMMQTSRREVFRRQNEFLRLVRENLGL